MVVSYAETYFRFTKEYFNRDFRPFALLVGDFQQQELTTHEIGVIGLLKDDF